MSKETQLLQLRENASHQLAQIKDIETGVDFIDRVKALETYAKATKQDAEMVKMIQEQKIRSMRILGKLLEETEFESPNANGANQYRKKVELPKETQPKPRLSDFGISKRESHTYQTIAAVPEPEFEKQIAELRQDDSTVKEITINRFHQLGKEYKQKAKVEQRVKENPWPAEEREMLEMIKEGRTVVINMNRHLHLLRWAEANGRYVRIDRATEWGNPFHLDLDGERDEVCNAYAELYFPAKKSLHRKLNHLKGKVLGCHCHPQQCHGHFLADVANGHIRLADLKNYGIDLKNMD